MDFVIKLTLILSRRIMLVLGFLLAIGIGITMGLVGSGGSILTVPVLVYLFGVEPILATTYSLFAIGISSFVGSIRNHLKRDIDVRKVVAFGLPSLVMVFLTRQFILPLIPDEIRIGELVFDQNVVLMVIFAVVMVLSAMSMIRGYRAAERVEEIRVSKWITMIQGVVIGFITGVVGAGGGFLIIPALINFYNLPIRRAIATSLAIVCVNSLFGFAGDLEKIPEFEWSVVGWYTALLIGGVFIGFSFSKHVSSRQLKKGLGYLILFMGVFIIVKEMFS